MSDSTTPAPASTGAAPALLFGAPVASNAGSGNTAVFDTSNVRPFGAPATGASANSDAPAGDGEDCSDPNFKPLVENLQKVEARELGDNEVKIFTKRSKVYRFVKESNEWKERCVGDLNVVKNTETGRIRIEMRMEKTQRVQINHSLRAETKLTPSASSAKMWVWNAYGDNSFEESGEPINVTIAARFQDEESALTFKNLFEKSVKELEEVEKAARETAGEATVEAQESDSDESEAEEKTEEKTKKTEEQTVEKTEKTEEKKVEEKTEKKD